MTNDLTIVQDAAFTCPPDFIEDDPVYEKSPKFRKMMKGILRIARGRYEIPHPTHADLMAMGECSNSSVVLFLRHARRGGWFTKEKRATGDTLLFGWRRATRIGPEPPGLQGGAPTRNPIARGEPAGAQSTVARQRATIHCAQPEEGAQSTVARPPIETSLSLEGRDGKGPDSAERQRLPDPPPPISAPPPPGPAPDPAAGDPEARFREWLPPARRAAFDALGPGKRRQLSEWWSVDPDDKLMAGELAACLDRAAHPPPPAPTAPVAELLHALPGPHGPALLSATIDAVIASTADHSGSWTYVQARCDEIVNRTRSPDSLLVPMEKLWERLESGKPIENPAAYFTASVLQFDLDYGPTGRAETPARAIRQEPRAGATQRHPADLYHRTQGVAPCQ